MKIFTNGIHLNKEDNVKQINHINNFFNLQYEIIFESGYSILIDKEVLEQIKEKTKGFSK